MTICSRHNWMIRVSVLLLAIPALPLVAQEPPAPVLQAEQQRMAAMARAMQSAVAVFAPGGAAEVRGW